MSLQTVPAHYIVSISCTLYTQHWFNMLLQTVPAHYTHNTGLTCHCKHFLHTIHTTINQSINQTRQFLTRRNMAKPLQGRNGLRHSYKHFLYTCLLENITPTDISMT